MPLSRNLIIARHNEFPIRSCDSLMSLTVTGRWKGLVSIADYQLPPSSFIPHLRETPRHRLRGC